MASDQQVNSQLILQSLLELQRQGPTPAMEHLEKVEPDLASYLMETLSLVYHKLLALGAPAKKTQRVYRQIQTMALVCIVSLRKGHHELWRDTTMGEGIKQLEPADEDPIPPAAADPEPGSPT
jgi:hypothetical protein